MARVTEEPGVEEREGIGSPPADAAGAREGRVAEARGVAGEVAPETEAAEREDASEYELPEREEEEPAVVVRRRPLYRRPAFLIVAALVLLAAVIFGLRGFSRARLRDLRLGGGHATARRVEVGRRRPRLRDGLI